MNRVDVKPDPERATFAAFGLHSETNPRTLFRCPWI